MQNETYFLYHIQGYVTEMPDGRLLDIADIRVVSTTEKKALSRAKKLVSKADYRIAGVTEFFKT